MYSRVGEKRRIDEISGDDEVVGSLSRSSSEQGAVSPKSAMEHEKRLRREIANSNERRRMQSINAGFASLKNLLPKPEGEKLSKAAILQSTADYIYRLEQEKTRLLAQSCQLKRQFNTYHQNAIEGSQSGGDSPLEDRTGSGTPLESISTVIPSGSSLSPEPSIEELRRELLECRAALDNERKQRIQLEEYIKQSKLVRNQSVPIEKEDPPKAKCEPSLNYIAKCTNKEIKIDSNKMNSVEIIEDRMELKEERMELKEERISIQEGVDLEKIQTFIAGQPITLVQNTAKVSVESGSTLFTPKGILPGTGTLVTLISAKPLENTAPLVEVHTATEEFRTITSSESNIDGQPRLYQCIMDEGGSSNSKSLNTICEAIRHLEGDHMFEESSKLEEEVITDEMPYTVDEELPHQNPPQISSQRVKLSTVDNLNSLYTSNHHHIGGSMSHLTLQMMQEQDVPLELTTTHRNNENYTLESKHNNNTINSTQAVYSHSQTRPGVIVVKQP